MSRIAKDQGRTEKSTDQLQYHSECGEGHDSSRLRSHVYYYYPTTRRCSVITLVATVVPTRSRLPDSAKRTLMAPTARVRETTGTADEPCIQFR
jgi:hypothetical protein